MSITDQQANDLLTMCEKLAAQNQTIANQNELLIDRLNTMQAKIDSFEQFMHSESNAAARLFTRMDERLLKLETAKGNDNADDWWRGDGGSDG